MNFIRLCRWKKNLRKPASVCFRLTGKYSHFWPSPHNSKHNISYLKTSVIKNFYFVITRMKQNSFNRSPICSLISSVNQTEILYMVLAVTCRFSYSPTWSTVSSAGPTMMQYGQLFHLQVLGITMVLLCR